VIMQGDRGVETLTPLRDSAVDVLYTSGRVPAQDAPKVEKAIRARLEAADDILKKARALGFGSSTVERVRAEMGGNR